jgi:hypothetical protein
MRRSLLPICAALAAILALALPAGASARIVELGAGPQSAAPSCPGSTDDPCEAIVRSTGLQGRSPGGRKNPFYIRRDGYIVAFTLTLSKPTDEQVAFFNDKFGSPAEVRLAVLRRGDTRKTRLNYRLVGQSDLYRVDRYLGSAPTFVLREPLRVKKTNWIAITVPTWAPMLAHNLTGADWWRASRAKNACKEPRSFNQFSLQTLHDVATFGCTYHTARLLYTATYVPDPRPTSSQKQS